MINKRKVIRIVDKRHSYNAMHEHLFRSAARLQLDVYIPVPLLRPFKYSPGFSINNKAVGISLVSFESRYNFSHFLPLTSLSAHAEP